MELTGVAQWLNTACAGFDYGILQVLHDLAEIGGSILTPLFSLVSFIGEQGALMFLMAVILMVFKRTRKVGVCVFLAVGFGAVLTNGILKDLVARPRPFEDTGSVYFTWWQFVGSPEETGYSFPSGHVTAAMAGMTALFLWFNKRVAWLGFLYVILMGVSRNYLMVHYPTDVVAAIIIGALAALASYGVVRAVACALEKRKASHPIPRRTACGNNAHIRRFRP